MKRFILVPCFIVVATVTTGSVLGDAWDPTASFSNTSNPNGPWSYGWVNNSEFQPFVSNGLDGESVPTWYGPLTSIHFPGLFYPAIWLNTSSPAFGVQTGQLALQPGPDGEATVVQWTAPVGVSGLGNIQGQFLSGDAGIMQVGVFENGNWDSPLWSGTDSGAFNLFVPLTASDTIDFAVYGSFYSGNTPLEATITVPVPEPSTFALLAFGAMGLVVVGWMRRSGRAER